MGEGITELWLMTAPAPVRVGTIEVVDAGHYAVEPALESLSALADAKDALDAPKWELRDGVVRIGFTAAVHELSQASAGRKARAVLRVF